MSKEGPRFYWDDKHYCPIEGERFSGRTRAVAYVYRHDGTWHYRQCGGTAFSGAKFESEAVAKERCEVAVKNWLADKEKQATQDTPPEAEPLTEVVKVEAPEADEESLQAPFIAHKVVPAPPSTFTPSQLLQRINSIEIRDKEIRLIPKSKNVLDVSNIRRDGKVEIPLMSAPEAMQTIADLQALALLFWSEDWEEAGVKL